MTLLYPAAGQDFSGGSLLNARKTPAHGDDFNPSWGRFPVTRDCRWRAQSAPRIRARFSPDLTASISNGLDKSCRLNAVLDRLSPNARITTGLADGEGENTIRIDPVD
jgi:hypothetical protein